ncbi:hypothetical protein R4036_004564 [Salmonella enterica]|nr:hypothetical protein [Salmonella enterica]
MKHQKTASITLRLRPELMAFIEGLADERGTTKTTVITDILQVHQSRQEWLAEQATAEPDKLDKVIALLGTIAGKLGAQAAPVPPVRVAPAPQREATQRNAPQNADPRFVSVAGDADELIRSMTAQRASLEDIAAALNAAGYTTATGQEWTRSRLRDYRHKLKDLGKL